jgi:hypothetical protein
MFEFKRSILGALRAVFLPATLALAVASCATAPGAGVTRLEGTWHGWLKFDGQSCATYSWTFNPGGRFVSGVGTVGTWSQSGSNASWRYDEPPNTAYSGAVQGAHIAGTMSNGSGASLNKGVFQLTKAPSVAANSPAVGAWSGYWIVTTAGDRKGEKLDVNWTFAQNGDFIDSNSERVGRWTLNGSELEFSFDCSTVFRGTLTGNRVQGTFWLPQGGGVSGDFTLTK